MSNPKCVTHFTGCDCQEAKLAQLTQELEAVKRERDEARSDLGAKNLLWNSLIAERDRLQAQLATAKDALEIAYEKLKTLPWRGGAAGPTWLTIPRQALADIQAQGETATRGCCSNSLEVNAVKQPQGKEKEDGT